MIREFDENGDGMLSFEEFEKVIGGILRKSLSGIELDANAISGEEEKSSGSDEEEEGKEAQWNE